MVSSKWFRYILSLLVGVALLFGVTRFINVAHAVDEFTEYPWGNLGWVLALSLGYYLLKAIRWHYLLNVLDQHIGWRRSILVYLAGQWFAFTPAGEFVRAYLLMGYGCSFSRGSAAVTAMIVFDFLSLALVASFSVARFHHRLAFLVLPFTLLLMAAILAFAYAPQLTRGRRLPVIARLSQSTRLGPFFEFSRQLLAWQHLLVGIVLGVTAVIAGSAVLNETSAGYDIPEGLGQAAFVYSLSQLVGGLSLLPHGLGVIEGSSIALFGYAGIDTTHAASAIALFRLCTVGWSLILGGISLVLLRTPLAGPALPRTDQAAIIDR